MANAIQIPTEIIASLEAVLFACGGPVEGERLRELLSLSAEELTAAADRLRESLETGERGIQLIRVETAYQLCTKPFVAETVKKALELRKSPPLSKASLEVLAIAAYHQPVTRSFIEMVRGVDSSSIVASLCDKGLLAERGVLEAPGRPTLFGTTDAFLRCFGLDSLQDLPTAEFSVSTDVPMEPASAPVDAPDVQTAAPVEPDATPAAPGDPSGDPGTSSDPKNPA